MQITGLRALEDNYIWLISQEEKTWIVDPGDARPVLAWFDRHPHQSPVGILITHHHYDHTQGVKTLTNRWPDMPIYGPAHSPFQAITHPLTDNQTLELDRTLTLRVLSTPGHTLDHITYAGINHAFSLTGDTLFTAGCGRLFEGSAAQMATSLKRIRALPDETAIYCGHEYTWANIHFAAIVEPDNPAIERRRQQVMEYYAQGKPCVPATLKEEKATNPFLRFDLPPLKEILIQRIQDRYPEWQNGPIDDAVLFAALRRWKDELDMTGQLEPG